MSSSRSGPAAGPLPLPHGPPTRRGTLKKLIVKGLVLKGLVPKRLVPKRLVLKRLVLKRLMRR